MKPIKLRIKICSPFNKSDTVDASVQILNTANYSQYCLSRKGDKNKAYFTVYDHNYMDVVLECLIDHGYTVEEINKCLIKWLDGDNPKYAGIRKSIFKVIREEREERISELVSNFLADQFDYEAKRFKNLEG